MTELWRRRHDILPHAAFRICHVLDKQSRARPKSDSGKFASILTPPSTTDSPSSFFSSQTALYTLASTAPGLLFYLQVPVAYTIVTIGPPTMTTHSSYVDLLLIGVRSLIQKASAASTHRERTRPVKARLQYPHNHTSMMSCKTYAQISAKIQGLSTSRRLKSNSEKTFASTLKRFVVPTQQGRTSFTRATLCLYYTQLKKIYGIPVSISWTHAPISLGNSGLLELPPSLQQMAISPQLRLRIQLKAAIIITCTIPHTKLCLSRSIITSCARLIVKI